MRNFIVSLAAIGLSNSLTVFAQTPSEKPTTLPAPVNPTETVPEMKTEEEADRPPEVEEAAPNTDESESLESSPGEEIISEPTPEPEPAPLPDSDSEPRSDFDDEGNAEETTGIPQIEEEETTGIPQIEEEETPPQDDSLGAKLNKQPLPGDKPKEELQEEKAAEPQPAQETPAVVETEKKEDKRYGADFGRYHFALGAGRPTFSDLKFYKELYGKPKIHPDIWLDYYFFDWYVTPGIGIHTSYYKAGGTAANTSEPGEEISSDEIDEDSDLELTLIPVQAVASIKITPYRNSFITFAAWVGRERTYVQETRHTKNSESTESDKPTTYVNKGWNNGTVKGASISLRLDFLDRQSVNSMDILGFRSVHLTPYVEEVEVQKTNLAAFSRKTVGVLFTFESIL